MAKDVKEAKAPTAKQEARKALVEKVSEAYPDHAPKEFNSFTNKHLNGLLDKSLTLKKCNLGCLHAVAA
jgi:hypothetical protein